MARYMSICLFFSLVVIRYNKVTAVSAVQESIIQLKCPYTATADRTIDWKKQINEGTTRYTIGTVINRKLPSELKSRLKVTGDHTAGEYHLSISDVRKSDEGNYECELSGTSSVSRLQLTVITNIPTGMSIENVGLDKYLNGIEGHNLMIRCSAVGGDPAPDVKLLISESPVKTAKQSVQYTLSSVNRSYDGQNVTCLAGYEDISYYPFNDSARIFLKLKPYPPTFSSDSVQIEDTIPLVISCTSTGSRPMASIYWLLGDGRTNVTINSTPLPPTYDQTTDTYTVTSTLTYSINKIYNGKNLICGASNEATFVHGDSIENSKMLNVKYAPDIIVNSYTYRQLDADRTVTCKPSGNPDIYTYYKWQHKSRYGGLIREFVGNKTLKLPDVPVSSRYQDSGEYVCIASNGIKDKYNKFEQTGSGYLTVNALPVFTSDNIISVKQYGEIDKAVDIMVNVYSVPKFNIFVWTYNGIHITQNSAKYEASTSPTIVKDEFHGKEEQLDGFNVTLTIHNLTYSDFANYTVTLENRFGTVKHTMTLEITESLTSLSTIIGGVVGAIVTLGIVCASVMGIVFFKRRKGQDQAEKNDKSPENTGFQDNQKENEYEEVGNKCDVQQKHKTYESLGIKDTLNVYDDLENPKGLIPSKSSLGLYEALGNQDNPSMYTALQNQKEQTQLRKQPTETDIRKASNNPKENRELYTNQRPIENVYDNEGF